MMKKSILFLSQSQLKSPHRCFNLRLVFIPLALAVFTGCTGDESGPEYEISHLPPTSVVETVPAPLYEEMDAAVYVEPVDDHSEFVRYWLARMTTEEKIAQLIMPRLPWQTTVQSGAPLFDGIPFGGYILFGDNIDNIPQVQTLISDLNRGSQLPLFISTDEEGGRVSRTGGLFGGPTQSAFVIGQDESLDATLAAAQEVASRLNTLGINTNFAPVADIWTNPDNGVIGDRSFGHEPALVARHVATMTAGFESSGVFATLKHFPGHGDTYEDSHYQLAFHHHALDRFFEVEALPFIAGIEAGASFVMTGHISTPAVAGHTTLLPWMEPWIEDGRLPATFSDFWLQEILRNQLGFDGIIITDGLEMRALTDHFTDEEIALGAFLAGADILLIPQNPVVAFHALLEGYQHGYFTRDRLVESVVRVLRLKERL